MTHRNIVAEIPPNVPHSIAEAIIGKSVGVGDVGVVIKATQGARWRRVDVDSLFDFAEECEVFKGWLHYCEPGAGDPETEAAWLMSCLGSRPLELGIWLELDDLGGVATTEVAAWLETLVKAVSTPARPAALLIDPTVVSGLIGLPPSLRVIFTGPTELSTTPPWATRCPEETECDDGVTFPSYELASTRGLVPARPVAPLVPPEGVPGARVPEDASEEHGASSRRSDEETDDDDEDDLIPEDDETRPTDDDTPE